MADKKDLVYRDPNYFNGGELLVNVCANAFTFSMALLFSNAVLATIRLCASTDNAPAAWLAFFIVSVILFILILALWNSKKHLVNFATRAWFLHSA